MSIHIGKIIKGIVKSRGISVTMFADVINYSRRNVYEIFDRETIDTGLLQKINKILEQNLFFYYLSDAEIIAFKNKKIKSEELMGALTNISKAVNRIEKNTKLKAKIKPTKKNNSKTKAKKGKSGLSKNMEQLKMNSSDENVYLNNTKMVNDINATKKIK